MENQKIIKIAKDFSEFPGARYRADGPYSGQEFFEDLLQPAINLALKDSSTVLIDFDDTWGYASSFISEVFTRAVKEFGTSTLQAVLQYKSTDEPQLINKIASTIKEFEDAQKT